MKRALAWPLLLLSAPLAAPVFADEPIKTGGEQNDARVAATPDGPESGATTAWSAAVP